MAKRYIRRGDILTTINEARRPLTFDEIYDSFWEEPDPIDLQWVLDDMIKKKRIEMIPGNGRDRTLYGIYPLGAMS